MRRALVACVAIVALSLIVGGQRVVSAADELPDALVQIRIDRYDFQGNQSPAEDWNIQIEVAGGAASADAVATNEWGEASFTVAFTEPVAKAELLAASLPAHRVGGACYGPEGPILESSDSWSFEFQVSPAGVYWCDLYVQEVRTPAVHMEVKQGEGENIDPVWGWEFGVQVAGGAPNADRVTTDEEGWADFWVDLAEGVDTAEVTITDIRREGYRVRGNCGTESLIGDDYVFVVVRGQYYDCWFYYIPNGTTAKPTPRPTPPQTDALVPSAGAPAPDNLLLALAVAGVMAAVSTGAGHVTFRTSKR